MKLLIEIPEEVMETKQYTRYFGACSGKLIETLENGIEFTDRPTGKWIPMPDGDYCSVCFEMTEGTISNYCPNCGAYMKGET